MEILTVGDFAKICQNDIKVMSGFNGKILCKRFDPKKHTEIASREITFIWSEIEVAKHIGCQNFARANMCVFVNGTKEYNEHYRIEVK